MLSSAHALSLWARKPGWTCSHAAQGHAAWLCRHWSPACLLLWDQLRCISLWSTMRRNNLCKWVKKGVKTVEMLSCLSPRTSIYLGLVINKAQKVSLLEATGYRTSSTWKRLWMPAHVYSAQPLITNSESSRSGAARRITTPWEVWINLKLS